MGTKKIIAVILAIGIMVTLLLCIEKKQAQVIPSPNATNAWQATSDIKVAVLYCGDTENWRDAYSHLEQSLVVNLSVNAIDIEHDKYDLNDYDILYPDPSIMKAENAGDIKKDLVLFVNSGGSIFLENSFINFFDKDFMGVTGLVKLDAAPDNIIFPKTDYDLQGLQKVIKDFAALYKSYTDYNKVAKYDYGYAVVAGNAKVMAEQNGLALYTMNEVGQGHVFFTNPLLPNAFSINGFSLTARNDLQSHLANTTASANQLIRNEFAAYVSKEKNGYSIERVFGSFGRPSMAWELHYEEMTGMANDSAIIFGEMCKQYLQVPSYSIIRDAYWWFLRAESITYLLNNSGGVAMSFEPDVYENAYSSGKHIVANGQWLNLVNIKDAGSYFVDYKIYDQRAYPFLVDLNGDDMVDIVSGSSDGYFYFYPGIEYNVNLKVDKAEMLLATSGAPIKVAQYSSPVICDINNDGFGDIVSGCSDGNIYWFAGKGNLNFEPQGMMISTGFGAVQTLPDIGDINGDGAADLVIGSSHGDLAIYYGKKVNGILSFGTQKQTVAAKTSDQLGLWLSPRLVDLNNNGVLDLAVGTFDGYVAKLINHDGVFKLDGYFESTQMNFKGNHNLKFANNCVPFFYDLNGDGQLDLIAGQLEYGLAYPIESPYFPYHDQLAKQIAYMQDNYFYIGPHFYTHQYASNAMEEAELAYHKAALQSYGVDLTEVGTNQHTWYMSSNSSTQSYLNAYQAGLLWNSGSMPPNSSATPQSSAENVLSLPFYLIKDNAKSALILNTSTLLYGSTAWTAISAAYDMPICIYYHCDFVYNTADKVEAQVREVAAFGKNHNYNFVMEDQLAKGVAAAYNTRVKLNRGVYDGSAKPLDLSLSPASISQKFELYNQNYQNAVGAKIEFAGKYLDKNIATDADVWFRDGNTLYIALNKDVRIFETEKKQENTHLERINIPANVAVSANGAKIDFLENGMQQVEVSGKAKTVSEGWTKTREGQNTIFTKYGAASVLEITY